MRFAPRFCSVVVRAFSRPVILPILAVLLTAAPAWAQLAVLNGPNYGTYSVGEVQVWLSASGGDGVHSWELVGGSLPPGVALRTDLPPWFPPGSSAGLIGVATTPGDYSFTLRVTSGGLSTDQAATLTITSLTITEYWDLPQGFVGKPYGGYTVTGANAAGPLTWSVVSWGPLPAGLTLDGASGQITGTPITAGYYNVGLTAHDGVHAVTRYFTLIVYDVAIPTPSLLPAATVGQSYTTTITASGGTPPYQFSSNGLPPGLVLDRFSGEISGTPAQSSGRWTTNISAVDSNGFSYDKTFALQVLSLPHSLPSVTQYGQPIDDCSLGVPCARWIGTGNANAPLPYTFTATGLPPGMEVRWAGAVPRWLSPGDGVLIGTPLALGNYNVQVTVTDANGAQATSILPLRVSQLYLNPYPVGGTIDVPYSERLRVIGGDLPYTASLFSGTLPVGVTLDGSSLLMSGTPIENGSFSPDFSVTDRTGHGYRVRPGLFFGGGSSTIQITSWYDLGTWRTSSSMSYTFMACCLPIYQWSVVGGALPPGLTLSPMGILSGTPTANGTFTFLVRVEDPTNTANHAVRQFVINFTPVSISSITPQTGYTLPFGNVASFYGPVNLTATGTSGAVTWSLAPGYVMPPGLTLTSGGAISGTPTHSGLYNFSVRVVDSAGNAGQAYLTLSIYPAGATPPVNMSFGSVLSGQVKGTFSLSLNPTGGTEPYTISWSPGAPPIAGLRLLSAAPWPTNLSPTATKGALAGVLVSSGSFTSSIRATDSLGQFIDRPITINVTPLELLFSPGDLPRATVGVHYNFILTAMGGSGMYTWSAPSLPAGFTLSPWGDLSGTPTTAGFAFMTVTLTDTVTNQARTFFVTIPVNPFPITAPAELPPATAGSAYSFQFTAPGCTASCTWTLSGSPPSGLSLSSTGLLSGTPSSTGTFIMTARVGPSTAPASKVVTLVINPSTAIPLSITSAFFSDLVVGSLSASTVLAQGGTRPYTWSVAAGSLPPGIGLHANVNTILGSGAPGLTYLFGRATTVGPASFTLQVTDAAGVTATRSFNWNVSALNIEYRSFPQASAPLVYNIPYSQFELGVGGSSNYTWTAETPLPPGLSIHPATGLISGTPLNTGSSFTTMRLDDDAGNTMRVSVSFFVSSGTPQAILFNDGPNLGTTARGQLYARNLTFSGGTGPYTLTALSPLPPGLALLTSTAVTSGTVGQTYQLAGAPLQSGTFSFALRAQDSTSPTPNVGVRTMTLVVSGTSMLSPSVLFDGTVGVPYSQTLLASNENLPTVWSGPSALPPGLLLSSDGVLSGTPTSPGTFSINVVATDASGGQTSRQFSLRIATIGIAGADILPIAVSGTSYTHAFALAGGGSAVWTIVGQGLPSGMTLSSAGVISGTTSSSGQFQPTIQATAGAAVVTKRVSLYVRQPNPSLLTFGIAATRLADRWAGEAFTFTFGGSNGVPPYTWTVAPGSALPPGLGLYSGSAAALNAGPGGTILAGAVSVPGFYSFDLIATDSVGQAMRRTFTLTVTPVALASGSIRTVTAGTAYAQQLTAVGGTAPYTFSMEPTSPLQDMVPPGLSLSSAGLLSGTTSESGNYTFRAVIQDAVGNTYRRIMFLTVNSPSGLRIGDANPPHTWIGAGLSRTLQITSAVPITWSVQAGALPPGVALAPNPSQSGTTVVTGRPSAAGVFTYTLRATDTGNASNVTDHTFTMTVLPMQVVTPPVGLRETAELPAARVGAAYSTTIKVAGGTPPYTFAVSPFVPLPPGLSLSATGVLSGTPLVGGAFQIQPVVSDSAGQQGMTAALTLVVAPAGYESPLQAPLAVTAPEPSAGSFYRLPLSFLRGGVKPITWSVAPGSVLPDGLALHAGSNGVPDFIAGIATTASLASFSLTAADSSGQTLAVPFMMDVSPIRVTPLAAPPGSVGVPYSMTFAAAGATAPYTYALSSTSDLPPGLSLTGNVLSGTPTHPGNFLVVLRVSESGANIVSKVFGITIDDGAAAAPAVSFSPPAIELTYVQGTTAPGPIPVSINLTSGTGAYQAAVMGMPGSTLSAATGTTPATLGLDLDVLGLPPGVHTGVLAAVAPGAANRIASAPIIVTVLPQPPCTYSVLPSSGSAPAAGGTGSFGVSAPAHCSWSAVPADPWLTITGGGSGVGAGTVSYTVASHGAPSQRNGTIDVNGATYTVMQFGLACSFAISPNEIAATAAGGMATIGITASSRACGWTATDLGASPPLGTGSGSVTITVPPNPTFAPVTLTATIAGQLLTVNQTSAACTASLSASSASALAAGGSGTVSIATPPGCPYSTTGVPSWLTVTSGGSGTGDGTISYSVQANSTIAPRITTVFIGGQPFTLTQAGVACSITVDASGLGSPFAVGGGVGSIEVIANSPSCGWTTSDDASWVSLAPITSAGSGAVSVSVTSNAASSASRTAHITIGGQTVSLTQSGTICAPNLQSANGSAPGTGGSGTVGVIAPAACGWSATSNAPWLMVNSFGGQGSSDVSFTAQANPDPSPRTGTLTVAGQVFTVSQAAAPCAMTLSLPGITVANGGATGDFTVTGPSAACTPEAMSFANWLTVATSYSGSAGTVTYTVAPNPQSTTRRGSIQVGDRAFVIEQLGAACAFSLNAYGALFDRHGGSSLFLGSPSALGCSPLVGVDLPTIVTLGPLSGPVLNIFTQPYTVSPFTTSLTTAIRRARITFGGQIFIVKQTSW